MVNGDSKRIDPQLPMGNQTKNSYPTMRNANPQGKNPHSVCCLETFDDSLGD
jgi:hypothetical protein